jgi:hypothetical protein
VGRLAGIGIDGFEGVRNRTGVRQGTAADLMKLAMLHDPLVGAICTPEEVWQMVDEMLVAQAHEQFQSWTGSRAASGVMREAALKELSRLAESARDENHVV